MHFAEDHLWRSLCVVVYLTKAHAGSLRRQHFCCWCLSWLSSASTELKKTHAFFCRSTIGSHKIRNNYTQRQEEEENVKILMLLYLENQNAFKVHTVRIVKFAENIINFGGKYIFYWKATVFKMPIMLYPESPGGDTLIYIYVEIWNQKWLAHLCGDVSVFSHAYIYTFFNSTPGKYTCFSDQVQWWWTILFFK